jgi:superfamily II DNA or RNA helicase
MELSKTSGIVIPRTFENEDFYKRIKNHLERTVTDYTRSNTYDLKFYVEGERNLKIPRFFPINKYVDCKLIDTISSGKDIQIEHNIKLRDELQESIVNFLMTHDRGTIEAAPGSGKTVVAIYSIAEKKKKSLIIVHRDSLVDQWIERVLQYTNLTKDDVSRLSSATFEKDLEKSIIVTTNQTFVSLLKRKRIEFLVALNKANIGILIADEVHTSVGAPTFSECSIHIPCKQAYGLSATPYRYDRNDDIIRYHLGDIFIPEGKASTMTAKVVVILASYKFMKTKTRKYVYWGGSFQKTRYLNQLKKSDSLLQLSLSLLNKMVKEDRNILYVSDRIDLIDKLYDSLEPNIDKSKFIKDAGLNILDHKVCFATTQKIRDGIDAVKKDCLIMPNPVTNIKQLSGRILRISPGKKEPILIDIVDIDDSNISRSLKYRLDFYEENNWNIKFLFCDDSGNVKEILKEDVENVFK